MSVEALAASLHGVITLLREARATVRAQIDNTDDQLDLWARLFQGSNAPEAADIVAATTAVRQALVVTLNIIDAVGQRITDYLTHIGAGVGGPAAAAIRTPRDRIQWLRGDLPPQVQRGSGAKTHGRLVIGDKVRSVTSGESTLSERAWNILVGMGLRRPPTTLSDVEIKTATLMRDRGIQHAVLVINNSVCVGVYGCETLVPILLPEARRLLCTH
jgi:hypothetical protein